jgi:phosphoglycerate dehydrogenase-like enzyme
MTQPVRVVICSPLEEHFVNQIRAVDERIEVLFRPDFLATPRYVSDHGGPLPELTPDQDRIWHEMLASAEIAFDFDAREPGRVNENFPRLRWIQATSAGVGQYFTRWPLDLSTVVVTTAKGVHADPLSEFVITGLLYFTKDVPALQVWQREHRWARYTTRTLAGQRSLVVGLGHIGSRTALKLAALGVEVIGAVRPSGTSSAPGVARVVPFDRIIDVIGDVDSVVLACPLTDLTRGLVSAECIAAMRPGSVIVNIARGQVIDEPAMIAALTSGALGGAALDVTSVEPLPTDSPLWDLPNVLISPHSASTAAEENRLIVDIFCDNLRRYLDGRTLVNAYDPALGY